MKLIDMDELAAFIREVNGDNRMGAGVLAENICDWIASKQPRYATSDNQVPDEAFEGEFQAWWESEGQYCRSGATGYEVSFAFQAWRHLVPTITEVKAENEKLRTLLEQKVMDETLLSEVSRDDQFVNVGIEGGIAQILVMSLGKQFINSGAKNYLELGFEHSELGEISVTIQRVRGKTAAQMLGEAQVEIERYKKAIDEITDQVDGNIRPTVRDCVSFRGDVQDIYGYCDQIAKIVGDL